MQPKFIIRRVDGGDDDIADDLRAIHTFCFSTLDAPPINPEEGQWWLVYVKGRPNAPVAFCGVRPGIRNKGYGYLSRSGVHPKYRGYGLQKRMIRVRERYARELGWKGCVTDTTRDNLPSTNNLLAMGYKMFAPKKPWGLQRSLYWRKRFPL